MPAPVSRPVPPGRRSESPSSSLAKSASSRATAQRPQSSLHSPTRRPTRPKSIDSKDISEQLKHATNQKESLMVKLQEKDQTIESLSTENTTLTSSLHATESRINEFYADQSRAEMELAQRIDIADKLRQQVRDLEREKRDLLKRYNDQTTTFDSERQSFYDSEQHLKSRIQSFAQARKQAHDAGPISEYPASEYAASESDLQTDFYPENQLDSSSHNDKQNMDDPETEPAEMTALKLELSTLSTSYASIQSTLVLLQSQLLDLKRVNNELQEENESYLILLREKTLSGRYDVLKVAASEPDDSDSEEDYATSNGDVGSLRSTSHRSTLDRVEEEEPFSGTLGDELARSMDSDQLDITSPSSSRAPGRKRTTSTSRSSAPRGESLADLPITGPGLDLAAELGRAENKDILEGNIVEDRDQSILNSKAKKQNKNSSGVSTLPANAPPTDLEALKTEVKSLKDANKALSLYASKIIDRIIAQEGYEHVLAVDYDTEPSTPATAAPPKLTELPKSPGVPKSKPRPQSVLVGQTSVQAASTAAAQKSFTPGKLGHAPPMSSKTQRRSMSFDWRNFSLFSNGTEKKPDPTLKPLTLKPGSTSVTAARKLDTQEDEEDRKERERLNATMKLMGIQPVAPSPSTPSTAVPESSSSAATPSANRRFSFFGRATVDEPAQAPTGLTQEALQHVEVENSLTALDNHEKNLSAEIAKGAASGFTEIQRKPGGRRSRRSAGGSGSNSGSTVWSMGGHDDDD